MRGGEVSSKALCRTYENIGMAFVSRHRISIDCVLRYELQGTANSWAQMVTFRRFLTEAEG